MANVLILRNLRKECGWHASKLYILIYKKAPAKRWIIEKEEETKTTSNNIAETLADAGMVSKTYLILALFHFISFQTFHFRNIFVTMKIDSCTFCMVFLLCLSTHRHIVLAKISKFYFKIIDSISSSSLESQLSRYENSSIYASFRGFFLIKEYLHKKSPSEWVEDTDSNEKVKEKVRTVWHGK